MATVITAVGVVSAIRTRAINNSAELMQRVIINEVIAIKMMTINR